MGASTFQNSIVAKSATQAFQELKEEAYYMHGHGG